MGTRTSHPCRQGVEEDAKGHHQEECTRCCCSQSCKGRQGCNEGTKAHAKGRTQSRWKTINTSSVVSNVIKTKIRLFVKKKKKKKKNPVFFKKKKKKKKKKS